MHTIIKSIYCSWESSWVSVTAYILELFGCTWEFPESLSCNPRPHILSYFIMSECSNLYKVIVVWVYSFLLFTFHWPPCIFCWWNLSCGQIFLVIHGSFHCPTNQKLWKKCKTYCERNICYTHLSCLSVFRTAKDILFIAFSISKWCICLKISQIFLFMATHSRWLGKPWCIIALLQWLGLSLIVY